MSTEVLIGIIIMLIGAHYGTLVYRLHRAEDELAEIRKDFAAAAIAAANAVAQAATAATAAMRK